LEQLLSDALLEFSTVDRKNLDELVGLVEKLVINKVRIEKMKNEFSNINHRKILDEELRIISQIQDSIKKVRLIKMKTINDSILELINIYNQQYNITASLSFEGLETEAENSLLNYIHSILIYFIKNIYKSQFNVQENHSNKIKLSASSDGKNLITVIENNAIGFDYENVCKTFNTNTLDLVTLNEIEARKLLNLINITENVDEILKLKMELEYLDGHIEFEAKLNEFNRIKITVPLSSSIMQGLLVKIGFQTYAVPLDFIETIINKDSVSIKQSNNTEMILYMDHAIKLVKLSELLNIETTKEEACILIVNANNKKAALVVDSLLDQTDMVIKPNHSVIKDVKEIKGSTILGDGLVTLVLNIPSILNEI
jgi:two-component system chemotaxis sensor kinase CheA